MAIYVVTEDDGTDWDETHRYKYRHTGQDGSAGAQDEVDRRRAAGLPVALWRWRNGEATLVEMHAAEPGATADRAGGKPAGRTRLPVSPSSGPA